MLKYIKLNVAYNFKSISTNVVLLLSSIVFILFMWLQRHLHGSHFLLIDYKYTWLFKLPIFIGSAIYITITTLFVFNSKRSLDELLIVKPITRKQIILSKFIIIWVFIFFQAFFWFFVSMIGSSFDTHSSALDRFKYSGSILYGSTVILLIVSSISIVVSQFLSIKSILTVVSVASFALPFYSFVSETLVRDEFKPTNDFYLMDGSSESKHIYADSKAKSEFEKSLWNKYDSSKNRALDSFDIFNQFNYAYSVFYLDNYKDRNGYFVSDHYVANENVKTIEINNEHFYMLLQRNKDEVLTERINHLYQNHIDAMKVAMSNHKLEFNHWKIETQFAFVYELAKKATLNISEADKVENARDDANAMTDADKQVLFARKMNVETYKLFSTLFSGDLSISTHAIANIHDDVKNTLFSSISLLKKGEDIAVYEQKKIINYYLVTFIWLFIAFGLHAVSARKYIKNTMWISA